MRTLSYFILIGSKSRYLICTEVSYVISETLHQTISVKKQGGDSLQQPKDILPGPRHCRKALYVIFFFVILLCLFKSFSVLSSPRYVVVVVLLFYVHGKHLRSCRDGQLT